MAGREGLVDTAVKTSRSGYLQRCLVKNLEGLRIAYDHTVRDSDCSIVQFIYGEDGLDVTKTAYSQQFGFLAANLGALRSRLSEAGSRVEVLAHGRPQPAAFGPDEVRGVKVPQMARWHAACQQGTVSESFQVAMDTFLKKGGLVPWPPVPLAALASVGKKGRQAAAIAAAAAATDAESEFRSLMGLRYMSGLAAPGEAVGVLAAQSVGEPSTQMTLNTFHFAGRGEANVTMGIPRLREVLMAASRKIGTPSMTLPLREISGPAGRSGAATLAATLRRVVLGELVEELKVVEQPFTPAGTGAFAGSCRVFDVHVRVRAAGLSGEGATPAAPGDVTFEEVQSSFESEFLQRLILGLKEELKRATGEAVHAVQSGRARFGTEDDEAGPPGGLRDNDGGEDGGGGGENEGKETEDAPGDNGAEGDDDSDDGDGDDAKGEARAQAEDYGDDEGEEGEGEEDEEAVQKKGVAATEGAATAADKHAEVVHGMSAAVGKGEVANAPKAAKPKKAAVKAAPPKKAGRRTTSGGYRVAGLATSLDEARDSVTSDPEQGWLAATIRLEMSAPKLLMLDIAQRTAAATVVRQTPGLTKCYVLEENGCRVQTDGINFPAAWSQADLVDVNRIQSNDIYAMLQTYGVEACRATLLNEVRSVFGAYGIGVDPRHLSVIADFMTHEGGYRPCSRLGMENNPSPFQKMSFETATKFLTDASLRSATDTLESPSSRLVLGRVVELGTGSVRLMQDTNLLRRLHMEKLSLQ